MSWPLISSTGWTNSSVSTSWTTTTGSRGASGTLVIGWMTSTAAGGSINLTVVTTSTGAGSLEVGVYTGGEAAEP